MLKLFLSLLTGLFILIPALLSGQSNYSGLFNKELLHAPSDVKDMYDDMLKDSNVPVENGLPEWPPRPKQSALNTIDRVEVTNDAMRALEVKVYFSGAQKVAIKSWVLDNNRMVQKEIEQVTIKLDRESSPVDITLTANLAENQKLLSGFLIFSIADADNEGNTKNFAFKLPKKWYRGIDYEHMIIQVKAEPFLSSGKLNNPSQLPIPGKSFNSAETLNKTTHNIPDSIDKSPLGPSSESPISLLGELKSDVDFQNPASVSRIQIINILEDKNPYSGVYYFLPSSYNLRYDYHRGFDLSMTYGTSEVDGKGGNIITSASLTSGISNTEFEFVKALMKNYKLKHNETPFTVLKPVLPRNAEVSFSQSLNTFNVSSEKISVTNGNTIYDPIQLSWTADSKTTNVLFTALGAHQSISGSLLFKPENDSSAQQNVPLYLSLGDPLTIGKIELTPDQLRKSLWRNIYPYPLKLYYIHVLIMNTSGGIDVPCIYSWKLGDKVLPPKAQAQFDASAIPGWVDNNPKVKSMWIEYGVESCSECDEEIIEKIRTGTTSEMEKQITFNSMGLLSAYTATFIQVNIRSKQLDPKGKFIVEKSVMINKDDQDFTIGPFFTKEAGNLKYDYRISLITSTKTYYGDIWIPAKDLQIYLNKGSLKQSLGNNLPPEK